MATCVVKDSVGRHFLLSEPDRQDLHLDLVAGRGLEELGCLGNRHVLHTSAIYGQDVVSQVERPTPAHKHTVNFLKGKADFILHKTCTK